MDRIVAAIAGLSGIQLPQHEALRIPNDVSNVSNSKSKEFASHLSRIGQVLAKSF